MPQRPRNAAPTGPTTDRELVEDCLEALEALVPRGKSKLRWPTRPGPLRVDGHLDLRIDGQHVRFALVLKRGLRKDHVGPLVHRAREVAEQGAQLLVCAERIHDGLGEELREHGLAYLDLGGNAYLRGPGLHVLVAGRRPVRTTQSPRRLTRTAVRLLGVFLRDADAGGLIQTELATRAGIALGAVGKARNRLADLAVMEHGAGRNWWVADREAGLELFAEGWALHRHHLKPRRYRMLETEEQGTLEDRLAAREQSLGCLIGGELAAAQLTGFLETDRATLHVPPGAQKAVMRALTLVPDEAGPITMLERYGTDDEVEPVPPHEVPLAHPLFVWAECLTVPDERVAQAAERLHDRFLTQDA